jgi:hypothetical protein
VTPPESFVRDLRAYDPALRARWATRTRQWFIEVKLDERVPQLLRERPNPWGGDIGHDLYAGWREGYLHVTSVPVGQLEWSRVAPTLHLASIVAKRRIDHIADQVEAIEAEREAAADKAIATWAADASSDAYDRLAWAGKRRVDVPVEVRDGYVVSDRRTVSA